MFEIRTFDFVRLEAEVTRAGEHCWLNLKFVTRDIIGEPHKHIITVFPKNHGADELSLRRLAQAINESQQPQELPETVPYEDKYPLAFSDGSGN